ncbi:RagB/SusD family nutrient uptake outer membrane protein [Flammeovirgaceae bacterium SG7u.111]|nr:RagB/SusD family nutrient uptake outer membrane protein [Flammeovirgaceae bacterium SG7u.132]WPO33939.1 RagB/SusD family nutrient uptake outer membrane protein [Flammeovirgaceae bacterium SG7u.111]
MKITKKIALTLSFLIVFSVSCKEDFLEVLPTASLSEAQLASIKGMEGSLIGAYSILLGRDGFYSSSDNWFWGSVVGGEANKGSDPGDQSGVNEIMQYNTQTTNGEVNLKYRVSYEGVARSNAVLKLGVLAEDVPDEAKVGIIAEARFLRGHYYFEMKKIFGDVPYVDETWDGVTPVANDKDLWPMIEADLDFAYKNLPETMSDPGRANKWAAAAYLAKAYVYQEKWSEAKVLFDAVIADGQTANGQKYGLVENYANIFRSTNDNHEESVFAIQASANTGTVQNANAGMVLNFPHGSSGPERPGGCCGFFQPTFDMANSFRTDANGLPLLDGSYNDGGNALKNDFGMSSHDDPDTPDPYEPDAGNVDPRLDHSVGRRGIPYLDWGPHPGQFWIRSQPYAGPYSPKKFIYYKGGSGTENDISGWTPGYTALNVSVIRYADVLLLAAETEAELGNLEAARALVNQVRERAANSEYFVKTEGGDDAANYVIGTYDAAWTDKAAAIDAIRFERKLELSGEGQRFFDLVRWGIAEPTLNAFLANERSNNPGSSMYQGAKFDTNKDEYQPIPQNEIDLQGTEVLKQNPGY